MPPIQHLLRPGRAFAGPSGKLGRAVTTDPLDPWMVLEPPGKGLGTAVGQQINRAMPLQIDQDRPVGAPAPEGKIINPQDAWSSRGGRPGAFGEAQEGIGADRHPHLIHKTLAGLTAERDGDQIQDGFQACRSARMSGQDLGQPLRKGAPGTLPVLTAKAADLQEQMDGLTADWQVLRRTAVITMDPMRYLLTGWANCRWFGSTSCNGQRGLATPDLLYFKIG